MMFRTTPILLLGFLLACWALPACVEAGQLDHPRLAHLGLPHV